MKGIPHVRCSCNKAQGRLSCRDRPISTGAIAVKLEKLGPDDSQREEIIAAYARDTWLLSAAKRVEQIQAVTHSLKPVHPDARGTNLYVDPLSLPSLKELGSHVLGQSFEGDVVGNAAALDVYKLLKLEADGIGLLAALLANDEAARSALHDDPVQAQSLSDAFKGLTQLRAGAPSSHTRAKQMYWLAADDPCVDDNYVLMAPLHATSLVHELHAQIQEDRFGDANKAARQARRERKPHDGVYRDYPGLAAQKLGGTKPQNISQLNSERGGVNYLLASLPPTWSRTKLWQPAHVESVFEKLYIVRPEVRRAIRDLRAFLATEPAPNLQTRQRRDAYIDVVVDEIVTMAGEFLQTFPAGWTRDVERFRNWPEKNSCGWTHCGELPEESEFAREWLLMNWPNEIGRRFANWLNRHLSAQLPVGDVEARQWKRTACRRRWIRSAAS